MPFALSRPRMTAAFVAVTLACTAGLASAGSLPGAAQDVASAMLAKVGISGPGLDEHAGTHPRRAGALATPLRTLPPAARSPSLRRRRISPASTRAPQSPARRATGRARQDNTAPHQRRSIRPTAAARARRTQPAAARAHRGHRRPIQRAAALAAPAQETQAAARKRPTAQAAATVRSAPIRQLRAVTQALETPRPGRRAAPVNCATRQGRPAGCKDRPVPNRASGSEYVPIQLGVSLRSRLLVPDALGLLADVLHPPALSPLSAQAPPLASARVVLAADGGDLFVGDEQDIACAVVDVVNLEQPRLWAASPGRVLTVQSALTDAQRLARVDRRGRGRPTARWRVPSDLHERMEMSRPS